MIITPKIQGTGVLLSLGRRSAPWIVALAAGSLFLACSGTIETPTDEYPSRGSNASANEDEDEDQTAAANDEDDDAPAAPRPQAPAAADDEDEDEDPPAQPAAEDDEDPPVDEEPPAEDEPPAASGGVAFEADVFPILSTACAPCHAGGGFGGNNVGGPDLATAFEDASRVADRVVARIEEGGMPPACGGGAPGDSGCVTEDELATIQAWIDAGLPE